MELHRIAIRAIFSFLFLLLMLRLSGKRVVSQAGGFDFVLSLILGDLIDDALFAEVSIAEFVVAAGTLVIMDLVLQIFCQKNDRIHFLLGGRPTIILQDGKPDSCGMKAEHVSSSELQALLRVEGFDQEKWDEIKLALIENSGEASVLRKSWAKPVKKKEKALLKGVK